MKKLVVQEYQHPVDEGSAQMRHVFHDWSNENIAKILQQFMRVMKPGSEIMVVEVVIMPSNVEESSAAERYMRYVDCSVDRSSVLRPGR